MLDNKAKFGILADGAKLKPLALTLLVGLVIWLILPPEGVDDRAWQLLAIFIATVIGIITKPLPIGAVAILGIATVAATGTTCRRSNG